MKLSRLYLLAVISAVSAFLILNPFSDKSGSEAGRIAVITRYYGITAEEIEQIITIPLEQAFSSIAGIEELNAYSEFSLSRIDMKLFASAEKTEIITQIRERTDRIYGLIRGKHQAVQKPQIVTSGSDQQAVFSAAVSYPGMTARELRPVVENKIKPEYSKIPGLGEIDVSGGAMHEIHVALDTDKAAACGYGSRAAATVIQASNIYVPCGSLDEGTIRIPLSLDARISGLETLRKMPVAPDMKLSDIADIRYSFREPDNISRYNGSEKVGLYIKSSAPDLISISGKLHGITEKLIKSGYEIEIINDRGAELKKSFVRIIIAIGTGILISSLLLFAFGIDSKRLFFLAAGQPLIIITAAGVASAVGLSADSFLLAGFAVGIGMILDSSILITGALKAGFESYRKILKPLVSSTLSTLIALLPVISLRAEIPGLASLVAALGIILTVSLILSAVFLPALYTPGQLPENRIIIRFAGTRRRMLAAAGKFIDKKRAFLIYTVLITAGITCLTGLHIRMDRPIETSVLFVHLELETGESLQSVDEKMSAFIKNISNLKSIKGIQSVSRRGGGSLVIAFDEKKTDSDRLTEKIKIYGRNIQGGFLYFPENDNGSKRTGIRISVTGDDTAELKTICRSALKRLLKKTWAIEGVLHFKEDSPAYHYITDPESLYDAGISAAEAATFLRWNLQGPVADKWHETGTERDLRVMSRDNETLNSLDIAALKIPLTVESTSVRLDQLGEIIRAEESLRINRFFMQHSESFTVICEKDDPVKLNEQIWNELENIELDEGYIFIPSTMLIRKQAFYRRLWIQFAIALMLIIFMLCIERESFIQPLLIMMQLPPILSVPVILLRIIGAELGPEAIIGLTLLAGMGINNGILIMDNLDIGIMLALKKRFNGLFLTTATSVAGMIPLLFTGNAFFINIAVVFMSGLSASFFTAVFIFPALLEFINTLHTN